MELGMIGLGKMGSNMARRLLGGGHSVVAYDPVPQAVQDVAKQGASAAGSVSDLITRLAAPRAVWIMVPSGDATEGTISKLAAELSPGDIVIDGGNSNYKDSKRRAGVLGQKGIHFLDVGTSGGIWGLKEGYCLMIGGEVEVFRRLEPVFKVLAPSPDTGYGRVGPSGASYAEGFELMQAKAEFDLDLGQVAQLWRYGSVIRSWLLDLAAIALKEDPNLAGIQAYVDDSGEGRWTVEESIELAVPTPVITQSLQARFRSRQEQPFGVRLLAALRQQFGGHAIKKAK
jgi:6-phosphogluconate dehydrogenase